MASYLHHGQDPTMTKSRRKNEKLDESYRTDSYVVIAWRQKSYYLLSISLCQQPTT